MVLCACGKPIDKVPTWLGSVAVSFVCNNCPNRQVKNIATISLETPGKETSSGIGDLRGMEEFEEEEAEDS